jgi:hypothetical protein
MQACKNLTAALLCLSTLGLAAQQIDDPANLMGERVSAPALADTLPIDHGAPALEQLLRKLRTRASMMLIVAHPDDEDGGSRSNPAAWAPASPCLRSPAAKAARTL